MLWRAHLHSYLLELNFTACIGDLCVYILPHEDKFILIAIHVDDFACVATPSGYNWLVSKLKLRYGLKSSLTELILGIRVTRTPNGFALDQEHYIVKSIVELGLESITPRYTPLSGGAAESLLSLDNGARPCTDTEASQYRSIFWKLMYASVCTRPDISYSLSILGRYLQQPNSVHLSMAKGVVAYLKGTSKAVLNMGRLTCDQFPLLTYVDSDFANSPGRRSTTGYCIYLGGSLIAWNSRLQDTVATSTTEAEYIALFEATKETVWLRQLVTSMGYAQEGPTIVNEDNLSCIALSRDNTHHSRTKHINIKYHFTREKIENGVVKVQAVSSLLNVADTFTKVQPVIRFQKDFHRLGLELPHRHASA